MSKNTSLTKSFESIQPSSPIGASAAVAHTLFWLLNAGTAKKLGQHSNGIFNYHVLADNDRRGLLIAVTRNEGGGYFSRDRVPFRPIAACLEWYKSGEPSFASKLLNDAFMYKSANNAGFLSAVLNSKFAASINTILAGVMGALSKTLAEIDNVTDVPETRMADFVRCGVAVERALHWPEGSFKEAYAQNQQQMSNLLGDGPLTAAIRTLVKTEVNAGAACTKTPTELLAALREVATRNQVTNNAWPMSQHSLGKHLKKNGTCAEGMRRWHHVPSFGEPNHLCKALGRFEEVGGASLPVFPCLKMTTAPLVAPTCHRTVVTFAYV